MHPAPCADERYDEATAKGYCEKDPHAKASLKSKIGFLEKG
jgi:hypothetical protein